MENDNITKLPAPNAEELAKQHMENVKKQRDSAKQVVDSEDFVVLVSFKKNPNDEEGNRPIIFTNMMITSSVPREKVPLLPILGAASEMLTDNFNHEVDGLKKFYAQSAKAQK